MAESRLRTSQGSDVVLEKIDPGEWKSRMVAACDQGYSLTWLGGEDFIGQSNTICVHAVLVRYLALDTPVPSYLRLETHVDRDHPVLDSVAAEIPAARWFERETHDLFGVAFDGGDCTPLLYRPQYHRVLLSATKCNDEVADPGTAPSSAPLLKSVVLGARVAKSWPGESAGAVQESARRRTNPPGVPDASIWGDREPGTVVDPEKIASAYSDSRGSRDHRSRPESPNRPGGPGRQPNHHPARPGRPGQRLGRAAPQSGGEEG